MKDAEAYTPMKPRQLYDHMDRFQSDNSHSSDVNCRWLSTMIDGWKATVAQVMNIRLEPENVVLVNAFRASELEKQIADKRREVERLERDLRAVKPAT